MNYQNWETPRKNKKIKTKITKIESIQKMIQQFWVRTSTPTVWKPKLGN